MLQKKLEELNLLDDFLFSAVLSDPNYGELFGRKLLKILFNKEVKNLKVVAQKYYGGMNTKYHGARLDVYLEDEDAAALEAAFPSTIYDIEPDRNSGKKANLPRRVRFYHSLIDSRSLDKGEEFGKLKNVIVLFICSYDPFDSDRIWYTMKTSCLEEPDLPYDDGSRTIFLYTKGTRGEVSEQVRELLRYFEDTTRENAANENLKELQSIVEAVKQKGEVTLEYMKWFEVEQFAYERGKEEGEEKARQEREKAKQEHERAERAEKENEELKEEIARLQVLVGK